MKPRPFAASSPAAWSMSLAVARMDMVPPSRLAGVEANVRHAAAPVRARPFRQTPLGFARRRDPEAEAVLVIPAAHGPGRRLVAAADRAHAGRRKHFHDFAGVVERELQRHGSAS